MYGYIYKTINLVNQKIYIGKHRAKNFEPQKYIGSGTILRKAIKKYGKENFNCELVEYCETKDELNAKEKYWISFYRASLNYNLAPGGEGGLGRIINDPNSYWSDPVKRAIAIKKTKVSLKKYYQQNPDAHKGSNNPNFGNTASAETRQKISERLKNSPGVKAASRFTGHRHTAETKLKIGALKTDKIWINNGASEYVIDKCDIIPEGYLRGKLQSDETAARLALKQDTKIDSATGRKKAVLCIELAKSFASAREASRLLNINASKISACCHLACNTAGGYHWKFINAVQTLILCIETNISYNTITAAAEAIGITAGKISECCNGKRQTAGGYHWKYITKGE